MKPAQLPLAVSNQTTLKRIEQAPCTSRGYRTLSPRPAEALSEGRSACELALPVSIPWIVQFNS